MATVTTYDLQFVEGVAAVPVVRLDVNAPGWTIREADFGMPQLNRAVVSTLLADGDRYPAAAYGNRTLTLTLRYDGASADDAAAQLQRLYRELDRPTNVLLYRPGTSGAVFFRTFRCGPSDVVWDPFTKQVRAAIPAEPFAVGLLETLPQVTVGNDPGETEPLNANPWVDVDTPAVADGFGRVTSSGWGVADSGQAWSTSGGSAADYSTDGAVGVHSVGSVNVSRRTVLAVSMADVDVTVSMVVPVLASGAAISAGHMARHSGSTDYYAGEVVLNTDQSVQVRLRKNVGGTLTTLATSANVAGLTHTVSRVFRLRMQLQGSAMRARVWDASGSEPTAWHVDAVDTSLTAAGQVGARSILATGNTSPSPTVTYDDLVVAGPPAGWIGQGGIVERSTAQSHEGAAALLLTPDGVTATAEARAVDLVPVTAGQVYRASAWVRCAVSRSISCNINWHNAGGGYMSTSTGTTAVTANVWTLLDFTATAPVGSSQARLVPASLSGTPAAGQLTHVDEARIRLVSTTAPGGLCFDVSGIKGDVETPLYLRVVGEDVTTVPSKWTFGLGRRQTMISVRRRGTPSAAPGVFAAESLNLGDDTTLVTGVAGAHGGAVVRTNFATSPGMVIRFGPAAWPTAASPDLRGTYRQLVRCRKSVAGDVIQMRAVWSQDSTVIYGDILTLPGDTAWRWIDLGLIQIPMGYDPATDGLSGASLSATGPVFDTAIARLSGSGTVDSDSVAFVPADDRMLGVVWPTSGLPTAFVVDSAASGVYGVGSAGEVRSAQVETAGLPPMVSPGVTNRVWWLRDVGSEFATGDDATGYTRITPYYWPRYLHVRPVTT
ncbi:carbohydrate binding domain-containing protein [Micromonospora sp. WMMD734]|uniref:carbohydrate binding domain-containing protein n=1 Tax=Micromonospora sp. WMMD734 TaxID=3404129 RepID=UPI003B95FDBD